MINGVRKLLGSVDMFILFILVIISYICYNLSKYIIYVQLYLNEDV